MIQGNALLMVFPVHFIAPKPFATLLSGLDVRHLRRGRQIPRPSPVISTGTLEKMSR